MPIGQRGASVADHVAEPEGAAVINRRNGSLSLGSDLVIAGLVSQGSSLLGLERAGKLPVILTTVGLAALRREGRTGLGVVLLAVGGGMAWPGGRSADRPAGDRVSPNLAKGGRDKWRDAEFFKEA